MYLNETITQPERMAKPSFNVRFPAETVAKADRLEVWSSSFNDPGPDRNEFRLMAGSECLATVHQSGY